MTFWIFKLSVQEKFPDEHGQKYVYDSRHSVKVAVGDSFVYLDKRFGSYGFTGHGTVTKVKMRTAEVKDSSQFKTKHIYTAVLSDFVPYVCPFDIHPSRIEGKKNRIALGITNVNKLGWSRSIAQISRDMYTSIIDLAYRSQYCDVTPIEGENYTVYDAWSFVKKRHSIERFKKTVLCRQKFTCAICGTTLREVLDVAHISRYSTDMKNRANPANGIGLCAYCHRAFDGGAFRLDETGAVTAAHPDLDPVALVHVSSLSAEVRLKLLNGIDTELLRQRQPEEK